MTPKRVASNSVFEQWYDPLPILLGCSDFKLKVHLAIKWILIHPQFPIAKQLFMQSADTDREGVSKMATPSYITFPSRTVLQCKPLVHKGVVETTTPCLSFLHRGSPKRRPPMLLYDLILTTLIIRLVKFRTDNAIPLLSTNPFRNIQVWF